MNVHLSRQIPGVEHGPGELGMKHGLREAVEVLKHHRVLVKENVVAIGNFVDYHHEARLALLLHGQPQPQYARDARLTGDPHIPLCS